MVHRDIAGALSQLHSIVQKHVSTETERHGLVQAQILDESVSHNASKNLTNAISPTPSPQKKTQNLSSTNNAALTKLADIFTKAAKQYSNKEANQNARLPGVVCQQNATNNATPTPGMDAAPPGVGASPQGVASRTRSSQNQTKSITDEAIPSAIEISAAPLVARRLASCRFPLQVLCEIAGAVLDSKRANGV